MQDQENLSEFEIEDQKIIEKYRIEYLGSINSSAYSYGNAGL